MTGDIKVVEFPKAENKAEIGSEEHVRRVMAEARRLANLSPGEWQLWIDGSAERLGVPRPTLEASVKAIIVQREIEQRKVQVEARHEQARQQRRIEKEKLEARREQQKLAERNRKEKEKEFKVLSDLPREQLEGRLV